MKGAVEIGVVSVHGGVGVWVEKGVVGVYGCIVRESESEEL